MPQWLPYLMMGMSLVVAVGLLWYGFAGGEEEDDVAADGTDPLSITASEKATDPFAQTTEEQRGSAGRRSRVMALKESLERSLDSREGIRGSDRDRMLMPWFMLVGDRKSTRLNSSHLVISYAVFCLKKKTTSTCSWILRS